jgi:tetratricopeptide (TPR) repeat protein
MARGNWNAALEQTRKAASEFAERGDLSGELEAHYWTLSILRRTESENAVEEAERLLAVIDDLGERPEKHVIPVTLFNILLEATAIMRNAERYDDVLLLTDRIARLPEPYFVRGGYAAQALKQRGLALFSLGRIDEASDTLQLALQHAGSYLPDWWAGPIEDALAAIRDEAQGEG